MGAAMTGLVAGLRLTLAAAGFDFELAFGPAAADFGFAAAFGRAAAGLRFGFGCAPDSGLGSTAGAGWDPAAATRAGRLALRRCGRECGRPLSTPGGGSSLIRSHDRVMIVARTQGRTYKPDKRITTSAKRPQASADSKEFDRNFETYGAVLRIKLDCVAEALPSPELHGDRAGVPRQRVDFKKCSD